MSLPLQIYLALKRKFLKDEIIEHIKPALERLADAISQEILSLNNGKSPKAVMLVGGGSQTPLLTKLISNRLNLPENRVAIRGIDAIQNVEFNADFISRSRTCHTNRHCDCG